MIKAYALFLFKQIYIKQTTESQNGRGWKGPLWVI